MNEQHTPGPWTLWTSCSWRRIKDAEGRSVCEPTVAADGHPDLIVNTADAALICAAPDLLAMLKEATNGLAGGLWDYGPGQDEHEKCNDLIEKCLAAIARALPQGAPTNGR